MDREIKKKYSAWRFSQLLTENGFNYKMFESETHLNYWRIKEGKHLLTKKTIRKICEFFHITKTYFNARLREFIRKEGKMLPALTLFFLNQLSDFPEEIQSLIPAIQ